MPRLQAALVLLFRLPCSGFRVSGFGFEFGLIGGGLVGLWLLVQRRDGEVAGCHAGFRISGFRVPDFGFQVSGSGFRVSGFGVGASLVLSRLPFTTFVVTSPGASPGDSGSDSQV